MKSSESRLNPIEPALLYFDEKGQPFSKTFDDIYFSLVSGVKETEHVFLLGNDLENRFATVSSHFVITEVGFGSGLNFIATVDLWYKVKAKGTKLFYYAFEKHPLKKTDLIQIASLFPDLAKPFKTLIDNYPSLTPGWQHIHFSDVELRLWLGDAKEGLMSLKANDDDYFQNQYGMKCDAIYFDGFAPKKNPDLWAKDFFSLMAKFSKKETTFATFSSARVVKDALDDAGFCYQKVPGFARKREMLVGHYPKDNEAKRPKKIFHSKQKTPWYLSKKANRPIAKVAVIGGGLAGCHISYFLAKEGIEVSLYEKGQNLAAGSSGNPVGLLNLTLSPFTNAWFDNLLASYLFANQFYQQFELEKRSGLVKFISNEKEEKVLENLDAFLNAYPDIAKLYKKDKLKHLTGIESPYEKALFFPKGGEINPKVLCQSLIKNDFISKKVLCDISSLNYHDNAWQINHNHYDALVIACGDLSHQFKETSFLPLKSIPGEVTSLPSDEVLKNIQYPLCAQGYISTEANGRHTLGATYEVGQRQKHPANVENLQKLEKILGVQLNLNPSDLKSRVSNRASTPDYLPIVGQVPNVEDFKKDYVDFRKDAKAFIPKAGSYQPNLFVLTGFGSNGLTYAPLSAYILSCQMLNKPQPVSTNQIINLSPARFITRAIARGKL